MAALEPVRAQLQADRAAAHDELAVALRSEPVTDLLERWSRWLSEPGGDPAAGGPDAEQPILDVVRRRIGKAQDRLVGRGRKITPATPADDVHELRKDAKKLRYLLECFGGLLPADAAQGVRQAAQGAAGQPRPRTRTPRCTSPSCARRSPSCRRRPRAETFVAIGQLIEQLEQIRQDARDEFAERFADYDAKATRQALRAVLDGAG